MSKNSQFALSTEAALLAFIVALTALIFLILITPELKALAVILWDAWL